MKLKHYYVQTEGIAFSVYAESFQIRTSNVSNFITYIEFKTFDNTVCSINKENVRRITEIHLLSDETIVYRKEK